MRVGVAGVGRLGTSHAEVSTQRPDVHGRVAAELVHRRAEAAKRLMFAGVWFGRDYLRNVGA